MSKTNLVERSPYKGWTINIYRAAHNWGRPYFAELTDAAGKTVGLRRGSDPGREIFKDTTYGSLATAREAARNAVNARIAHAHQLDRTKQRTRSGEGTAAERRQIQRTLAEQTIQEAMDIYYYRNK